MLDISLRQDEHVKHYSIAPAKPSGWDVRVEEDRTLRRLDHYDDWHRVERSMTAIRLEVQSLTEKGWKSDD
jgi:hypothetical protein